MKAGCSARKKHIQCTLYYVINLVWYYIDKFLWDPHPLKSEIWHDIIEEERRKKQEQEERKRRKEKLDEEREKMLEDQKRQQAEKAERDAAKELVRL